MTDIVERLRGVLLDKDNFPRIDCERWLPVGLAREAADEIKRLRATVEADIKEFQRLQAALSAFVAAAKDVQDFWSDPSGYTHNRLLTPMLMHEDIIRSLASDWVRSGVREGA